MRRRSNYFTAAGSFALAAGIGMQHFAHSNFEHFAGGVLMGVSIGLLILGLARQRGTSR